MSHPRKSILRKEGKLGSNHSRNHIKNRDRKGPSRGVFSKSVNLMSGIGAVPDVQEWTQDETLHQERCARRAEWDSAKNVYKLKHTDKATLYFPIEARAMPASTSKKTPEEREFVVDSGASMHMLSKKDMSSEELETLRRSRTPTAVWKRPVEKCKQPKKHKNMFTILISS